MSFDENLVKKKTRKGKISLIFASIFWVLFIITWSQEPLGFVMADIIPLLLILIFGYFFPFFALSLTIIGIVTLSRRNELSKKEMKQKKEKEKDEKIEELEKRLEKVEDNTKSDDEPENS
ncbi:MAG: hypothetical protein IIA83_10440 [Thaumarchaeota archaeon]|nr:hypothetical protein [Nitrososphaerota archaeon]